MAAVFEQLVGGTAVQGPCFLMATAVEVVDFFGFKLIGQEQFIQQTLWGRRLGHPFDVNPETALSLKGMGLFQLGNGMVVKPLGIAKMGDVLCKGLFQTWIEPF